MSKFRFGRVGVCVCGEREGVECVMGWRGVNVGVIWRGEELLSDSKGKKWRSWVNIMRIRR